MKSTSCTLLIKQRLKFHPIRDPGPIWKAARTGCGIADKFIYSVTGLVLGLVCTLGGIILFLNGVAGATSWTAKILGSESTITDAAPGAILFIFGLFVVMATRYKVTVQQDTKGPDKLWFI